MITMDEETFDVKPTGNILFNSNKSIYSGAIELY